MGASREITARGPSLARVRLGRRLAEIALGALVVAAAAQVALPVPFSPVLEQAALPDRARITAAIRQVLEAAPVPV